MRWLAFVLQSMSEHQIVTIPKLKKINHIYIIYFILKKAESLESVFDVLVHVKQNMVSMNTRIIILC